MDDGAILELFFARSESGITELDAKYGAIFHALAYNLLGDREDAAECVNDAYFGTWRAIPPERPEKLCSWVCRVVRNTCVDRLRRRGAGKRGGSYELALDELDGCLVSPENVSDAVELNELTREIDNFLGSLSEENRVIFLRRYWFADSIADIAGRVGMGEKAVSVRLTRIRKRLREYLKQREVYV